MRVGIQKLLFMFGCRRGVWKEEGLHPMLVWFVHLVYSDYQLHTVHRRSVGHLPLASPCRIPGILRPLFQVVFTLCHSCDRGSKL